MPFTFFRVDARASGERFAQGIQSGFRGDGLPASIHQIHVLAVGINRRDQIPVQFDIDGVEIGGSATDASDVIDHLGVARTPPVFGGLSAVSECLHGSDHQSFNFAHGFSQWWCVGGVCD